MQNSRNPEQNNVHRGRSKTQTHTRKTTTVLLSCFVVATTSLVALVSREVMKNLVGKNKVVFISYLVHWRMTSRVFVCRDTTLMTTVTSKHRFTSFSKKADNWLPHPLRSNSRDSLKKSECQVRCNVKHTRHSVRLWQAGFTPQLCLHH